MRSCALLLCLGLFGNSLICLGQSANKGAIIGTVVDPNGNVIPGVNITVTNVEKGLTRAVVTDERGDFLVGFLDPGMYKVSAEKSGFKKAEIADIEVLVGQRRQLIVKLEIGEISERVTVSSSEAILETETPARGEVIDETKVQNLPLNGREFIQLASLVAGAESGNPKTGAVSSKGFSISFNGARAGYNSYTVNGAESTAPLENTLISSPALDAIKEFRVETNMYSVQYGRSGGGVINVVTKSGTNQFHGTAYEYHRNKALDALPVLFQGKREDAPNYLFNQFGGTLGGPLYLPRFGEGGPVWGYSGKNRTFFFISYEGFRQKKPGGLIVSFAPTDKERSGDFSESINPYSGRPVVLRNPYTGQPIPGNKLPPELINPVGKRLMDMLPRPNYFGDPFLNLRIFRSGTYTQDKWLTRVDHTFSQKDSLQVTFNFGNYDNVSPSETIYGDKDSLEHDRTLSATYTHIFNQNLVNDLIFSHTWFLQGSKFVLDDKIYGREWGLSPEINKNYGSPRIQLYTIGSRRFTIGNEGNYLHRNRILYLKDNLVWIKGAHRVLMGGDFRRQAYDWQFNSGQAQYAIGFMDGVPGLDAYYGIAGYTFADLLVGIPSIVWVGLGEGDYMPLRRNAFSLYIQDEWKVVPRLTLTLGLRYDYEAPFSAANNQFMTLDFDTGLPRYAKGAPPDKLAKLSFPYETDGPNRPYEPSKTNFAPRVGFALRPFKDNRTVIRAGYGIFYTSETAFTTTYGAWVSPFGGLVTWYAKRNFWPDRRDRLTTLDKRPIDLDVVIGRSPGYFQANTPYYPTGYMQQWNLTLGRSLGWRTAVELAYVGSKGTNLNGQASIVYYSQDLLNKIGRQIPGWSLGLRAKGFNSKYNSMQLTVRKDVSHGLNFLAAYTWSHALAESSNDATAEALLIDQAVGGYFVARRWADADFDVRQRFSLSGTYRLPLGRGRNWGGDWNPWLNGLLGGWDISFIWTLQGGYPFTVYDSRLRLPDRVCDGNLPPDQRSPDRWFDWTCFPTHPSKIVNGREVNIHGNAPPNVIRGPRTNQLDLGVLKNFRMAESATLQLRFEAFNALNHPNFIGPAGNYFFNSASGAKLLRARDNRDVQVAMKIIF
jgi:hypothetical protein